MKNILIYIFAILLGLFIVTYCTYLFGFEETIITASGFILGKLLLNDLKNE
jgi:hypothetical protein